MNHFEKTKRYVHSGNICLAAYHWGRLDADRETIVLVHGYPDAADVWQLVAERLAADFNVVAYDVRGTGLSDIPETTQGYAFDYLSTRLISSYSSNESRSSHSFSWS
jgi:pimeloyl-ACP methyl ester carboxylesterase